MPIDHLPRRLQPAADRIRGFLLTDATVLLILGAECVIRGVAFLENPPPGHPSERWFNMSIWAVIWVSSGVACGVAATRPRSTIAAVCLSAAVALNALWCCSLATAALTSHGPDKGWGGAGVYGAVALLALWAVWRGQRTEVRVREVRDGH